MSALDVELANFTVRMPGMESSTAVRILMSVNNETVAKEMERRRAQDAKDIRSAAFRRVFAAVWSDWESNRRH